MSRYDNSSRYGQADWLIGTARRNPEALLVLAAGCALLLRSRGRSQAAPARPYPDAYYGQDSDYGQDPQPQRSQEGSWREGISRAADSAKDYASGITDRVSETASSSASKVSGYAEDGWRTMSRQASSMQSSAGRMFREQPMAVAVLGLAAGAAIAALLPPTDMEERAFAPAREAIADAAGRAQENLTQAAGQAGERLKQTAAERGLNADGLKEMARDVAQTFTNKASGQSGDSPSVVPNRTEPVSGIPQ